MDNQHKIDDFIKSAESNELFDVFFESIRFMNKPYYRIHSSYGCYKGTFDVSYNSFVRYQMKQLYKRY